MYIYIYIYIYDISSLRVNVLVHGTFLNVLGEMCKTGNCTAFEPEAVKLIRHSVGRNSC